MATSIEETKHPTPPSSQPLHFKKSGQHNISPKCLFHCARWYAVPMINNNPTFKLVLHSFILSTQVKSL